MALNQADAEGGKSTIYTIADELGVSASTVSRALSRPEIVRESVRILILDTAARQGFQINRQARGLATGSIGLIGVAVFDIVNPFIPPLIRSIDRAVRQLGHSIVLLDMHSPDGNDPQALQDLSHQVDGLIVSSPHMAEQELLDAVRQVPTALVNHDVGGLASVLCDNGPALHAAADRLAAQGHRKVLCIPGPPHSWAAEQRRSALRAWAAEHTGDIDLIEAEPRKATFESGRRSAPEIIDSGASAVLVFDDLFATGVVSGMAEFGHFPPKHYSLVGCDDVLLATTLTPQLSTIAAPFHELGQLSVQSLMKTMAGETPASLVLQGRFVERGTTGPCSRIG